MSQRHKVILLHISYDDYRLLQECVAFSHLNFNVWSFSAHASSSYITRLPLIMSMEYHEFVFQTVEGFREERKRERLTQELTAWGECYRTLLSLIYKRFVLSQSVCQTRVEKFAWNKCSILLRKFVNYGRKKFITFTPGPKVITFFMYIIYDCS